MIKDLDKEKKQLKQEYKERSLSMGVFLIRNMIHDKVFLAVGQDLAGIMNSHRFQLRNGVHRNTSLQTDWSELGEQSFAFEILEELVPPRDPQFDRRNELLFMEKMWLAKLQPYGERGYNQPKLSREEKLRRIAAKRLDDESDSG